LTICPRELEDHLLKDGRLASVDIQIVYPGDPIRIVNLMDVVQPLVSLGTLADTSLFSSELLNAIIIAGATQERVKVNFQPERILGGTNETHLFTPDPFIQKAGDSVIDTEEFFIAGIHDHIGGAKIVAAEY
jgi:hypothetical protein